MGVLLTYTGQCLLSSLGKETKLLYVVYGLKIFAVVRDKSLCCCSRHVNNSDVVESILTEMLSWESFFQLGRLYAILGGWGGELKRDVF